MVKSTLESGTVTIKNKQTDNSACLPDDDEGRSLQTKPEDGTDKFKVRVPFARAQSRYSKAIMPLLVVDCGQARQ